MSVLNKTYHIIFMEMIRKRLYNPLKTVGFNPQFIIINYRSCFFSQVLSLLSVFHHTRYNIESLVKYLHFELLQIFIALSSHKYEHLPLGIIANTAAVMGITFFIKIFSGNRIFL